jgi:hypothetical protein
MINIMVMRQKIIVTKICKNCNQPFDMPRWKHHQKFCSTKCKKESQIVKLNYNDILSDKSWVKRNLTTYLRKKIISHFENKCIFCGRLLKKDGNKTYIVRIPMEFTDGADILLPICEEDFNNMKIDEYRYKFFFYEELLKFLHSSEQ